MIHKFITLSLSLSLSLCFCLCQLGILTSDWVLSIAYTGQNIVVQSTHSLVKIFNICLYHRDYIVIEALLRSQGNVLIGEPAQVQVKQIYVLSKIA